MMQQQPQVSAPGLSKQKSYNEVVEYLDAHWNVATDRTLERMRKLDRALGSPSRKVPAIIVAGTNGKTLTIHFAAKLLAYEGLKVGTFTSPHILLYKERFAISLQNVPSRQFTELASEVIHAAETASLSCSTYELLAAMAFHYHATQGVDVAILEAATDAGGADPVMIAESSIAAVTRVTSTTLGDDNDHILAQAAEMITMVRPGMHVVSGDQSKSVLHVLHEGTTSRGGVWEMPLRKLAPLAYPAEQLHGRCAALAERVSQLFVEKHVAPGSVAREDSLLMKRSGQRGRPRLDVKRQLELHPKKTLAQFWKETCAEVPGKFQLLDKEKPSILFDTASNVDAMKQLLLGIRLLHYQRPLKGLTIIVGAAKSALHNEEFLRLIRYFFKKMPGHVIICPLDTPLVGAQEVESWDAERVANDIKGMKVKARACASFAEAFDAAKKTVDERNGLVVVCGSSSIVASYWKMKGIKKF